MSSIATRTGDRGTTQLMYGRSVPKTHPQVALLGSVDELSAVLTCARVASAENALQTTIYDIQQDLVALMGEVSTAPEDWTRYAEAGYAMLTPERLARIDQIIVECEADGIVFQDWNLHNFPPQGATLEHARTVCRRAERDYWCLGEPFTTEKPLIGQYLNRLADALWLLARKVSR